MDFFSDAIAGITPPSASGITAGANTTPADSGTGLPQYSWGYDPTTQSWGYFMNKAGSQSAQIGRKAGDKMLSYKAPAGDTASMQQEALNHLMNTQVSANTPATTNAAAPSPTNVVGSGIAAAANSNVSGGGGHTTASGIGGEGGPQGGIANVYGGLNDPSSSNWGATNNALNNAKTAVDAIQAKYGLSDTTAAKLANALGLDTQQQTMDKLANTDQTYGTSIGYSPDGGVDPATAAMARDAAWSAQANADANAAIAAGTQPGGALGPGPSGNDGTTGTGGDAAANGNTTGANYGNEGSRSVSAPSPSAPSGGDTPSGGGDTPGGVGKSGSSGGDKIGGWRHDGQMHAPAYAAGGPTSGLHAAASLPPRFVRGPGDGQSDSIPVNMSDGGMGHLADNEFVIPADAVSALGSGSSEAGARALYEMVDRIRQTAHGNTQQAKPVDPSKVMAA